MDIYVIDTSALIKDSDLFDRLNGEIILHTIVLEELDNLKQKNDTVGANARKVGDFLYSIKNRGDFKTGIKLGHKIIKFDDRKPNTENLRFGFDITKKDNLLLCVAKEIEALSEGKVIFVTGDKYLCLKACIDLNIKTISSKKNKSKSPRKNHYINRKAISVSK